MDAGTFRNEKVVNYLNKYFETVKINGDDASLGKWVKQTYDVPGYPTILILFPNGSLLKKLVGYRDAGRLLDDVQEALGKS